MFTADLKQTINKQQTINQSSGCLKLWVGLTLFETYNVVELSLLC